MPISGNVFADAAPRARSGASLVRPIVRPIVRLVVWSVALVGGILAVLLLAASTASADDGSLTGGLGHAVDNGLGQGVGETVKQVEAVAPKVAPQKPVAPKAVAPKPQPVHLQQVTEKVTEKVVKAVAPVAKVTKNLQPTQGIPAVDDVVRGATETVEHTVVAPVVEHVASTVSHTAGAVRETVAPVTGSVTHAATQAVNQVSPTTVLPPAAVLPPAPQVRTVEPVQAPAVDHHPVGSAAAAQLVDTDLLVAAPAPGATAATSSHHQVGSAFSGLSHETPTDFPQLPTAPAQGPVAQTGAGQSAGELAVLDAVLRDGSNGLTRLGAGDDGAPLSRAAVVDTRPA